VASEALHLTLCFLGWQPEGEVDAIAAACGVVSAVPPALLSVRGAAWLPPRRPRVLAARLDDVEGTLTGAQAALSAALAAGGWYEPEQRPYLAHVTVARVLSSPAGGGRGAAATRTRENVPPPPELAFRADRVVLYRSRLLRSGARYEALAHVELAG
jgi:2'-5' RNA ligase